MTDLYTRALSPVPEYGSVRFEAQNIVLPAMLKYLISSPL